MDCIGSILDDVSHHAIPAATPAAALRALIAAPGLVSLAGVYDALSARLLELAGLPVAYVSGYCVSAALLGLPDVGYVTLPEMVATAARIAERVGIPVICDGDDGYGNHLNVGRLVRGLERAGIAGVQIEDQVSPKRCGHMAGKHILPVQDMVAKISAAVEARHDADFVVVARTDAVAVSGFDDALQRACAYAAAGADVVFVEAPETMAQVASVPGAVNRPSVFNWAFGGRSPVPTAAEVEGLGYKFLLCPDTVFAVARTLSELYGEVRRNGTYAGLTDRMIGFDAFNDAVGFADVVALDRRFRSGTAG